MLLEDTSKLVTITLKHWSHSGDQSFRKCTLKWYRERILGMKKKIPSDALLRGLAIHHAYEIFHMVAPDDRDEAILIDNFLDYYNEAIQAASDGAYDPARTMAELEAWRDGDGTSVLRGLWKAYGKDEAIPKYSHTEFTGECEFPNMEIPYMFRLDALVTNVDEPFILETKTMSKDGRKDFDQHDLQAARNIEAINRLLKPDPPIKTLVYNFIVFPTKSRKGIFERRRVTPTPAERAFATHDLGYMVKESLRDDLLITHTFNKACQWTCDFYELCLLQKTGDKNIESVLSNNYTISDDPAGRELPIV